MNSKYEDTHFHSLFESFLYQNKELLKTPLPFPKNQPMLLSEDEKFLMESMDNFLRKTPMIPNESHVRLQMCLSLASTDAQVGLCYVLFWQEFGIVN